MEYNCETTKNDPCSNKGHHINSYEIIQQPNYNGLFAAMQEKYKRVINNTQFNELADNLGMTQEQRQNFIRIALARLAKP